MFEIIDFYNPYTLSLYYTNLQKDGNFQRMAYIESSTSFKNQIIDVALKFGAVRAQNWIPN